MILIYLCIDHPLFVQSGYNYFMLFIYIHIYIIYCYICSDTDMMSLAGSTASEDTIRLGDIDIGNLHDLDDTDSMFISFGINLVVLLLSSHIHVLQP